jgi:hypothetical protein
MPNPGQVYYLPPERSEGRGKGDRPHVVVSAYEPAAEVVTFAYGSTKATEARHGAAHVLVDPLATAYRGTGLRFPTYIYPSRLISYAADQLFAPSGRIIDEMPQIRAELKRALGLGQGVTREANAPGANRRGRLVEYASEIATELETNVGLVVTQAAYSRASRQQITIPLLDSAEFETGHGDVTIAKGDWITAPHGPAIEMFAAVPLVFTVFEPTSIRRYSSLSVSDATMSRIDLALAMHFGL